MPAESQFLINNKSSDVLALAAATLDAQLAGARGEIQKSIGEWRRAVELEAKIQYDEPPAWFYPCGNRWPPRCCAAGRPKEAEAVFREAIEKQPRDGRLLFGLWQSLMAQKRESEAALVEQQFNAAWKDATIKANYRRLVVTQNYHLANQTRSELRNVPI